MVLNINLCFIEHEDKLLLDNSHITYMYVCTISIVFKYSALDHIYLSIKRLVNVLIRYSYIQDIYM